jgi:hypothetical protein
MPLTQDPSQIKEVNTPWLPEVPWIWGESKDIAIASEETRQEIVQVQNNPEPRLSLEELKGKLEWDSNKKLIYDIYLWSIPDYDRIGDQEKRNYIFKLLKRELTLWENLIIKFREKYSDVDNIPVNHLIFLNSIIELGETWDISDKERKAQFFIFMFYKGKGYNFTNEEEGRELMYGNFSDVIKEFFEQGYFNTRNSYSGLKLEKSNNRSDYRQKELALVGEWIWNEDTIHNQFKELIRQKYKGYIQEVLALLGNSAS